MTSLIDVIFLLLLFFMLSSTFSRFAEIEFPIGGAATGDDVTRETLFLHAGSQRMTLNGQIVALEDLRSMIISMASDTRVSLIVSPTADTTAQTLVDLLGALRSIPDLPISIIGAS